MPLGPGTRLGPYEIQAAIGAGGMGEVYRARDTRLQRDVAIKVLPADFSADPDRLARFEQEARAAAALNHPNILAVFDIGTHTPPGGSGEARAPYIVSELLEGETLREKMATLPVRRAIDYAIQLARGLAAAHEKGIVHRDLKPENVFVTSDGRVKILDFGIAKLVQPDPAIGTATMLPTTPPQTIPGVVLGTTTYMSPEQVRGKEADPRSDMFAFGAILYEMLAGHRAFGGETPMDTMSAILKEDPAEIDTSRRVPPGVRRIVERCLEKEPAARFKSADDLAFALEALSGSTASVAVAPARQRAWLIPAVGAVVVMALVAGAFAAGRRIGTSAPAPRIAFETRTFEPQAIFNARFAPDGTTVIFDAALEGNTPQLFVSRANSVAPQPLGTHAHLLSVSSKGELAVLVDPVYISHRLFRGTLARMPIDGAPRPLLENVREADWAPDGDTLAIVRFDGLTDKLEYPVGTVLYESRGYLSDPRVSPDGTRVAFFEHPIQFDDRGLLRVVDREKAVRTVSGEYWGLEGIGWSPDGQTIFYSGAGAGFDYFPRAVAATGGSAPRDALPNAGVLYLYDVSRTGRWLVVRVDDYLSARAMLPGQKEEREFPWLAAVGGLSPEMSPDRSLLLFNDQSESAGPNYAVAVRKVDGSPPVRLGAGYPAGFSPDGTKVLAKIPLTLQVLAYAIGAGDPIQIDTSPLMGAQPRGWLPDGARVILCGNEPSQPFRCYAKRIAGGPLEPLTPEGFDVGPISPDGRTIVVIAPDGTKQLFSFASRALSPLRGATALDAVVGWRNDSSAVFVQKPAEIPARFEAVSLATEARTLIKEVAPPDRAGLVLIRAAHVYDDGRTYAYTYRKSIHHLYTVTGVTEAMGAR